MHLSKTCAAGERDINDGGRTPALRGQGRGPMPTLAQVLTAFPGKRFMFHLKDNDAKLGRLLVELLQSARSVDHAGHLVYGGDRAVAELEARLGHVRGFSRNSIRACAWRYALAGFVGWAPDACRDTVLVVPVNYASWACGWPHRFVWRMHDPGTEV